MTGKGAWRRGFTLVELILVLMIVGLIAGLTAPAFGRRAAGDAVGDTLAAARRRAISTGVPQVSVMRDTTGAYEFTALPDGGVVAPSRFGVDRFTGARAQPHGGRTVDVTR